MHSCILVFLMVVGVSAFSQDSSFQREGMPNALPEKRLLNDTLTKGPKLEYFRLPGGMICVKPDSTYHAVMPNGFRGRLLKRRN